MLKIGEIEIELTIDFCKLQAESCEEKSTRLVK